MAAPSAALCRWAELARSSRAGRTRGKWQRRALRCAGGQRWQQSCADRTGGADRVSGWFEPLRPDLRWVCSAAIELPPAQLVESGAHALVGTGRARVPHRSSRSRCVRGRKPSGQHGGSGDFGGGAGGAVVVCVGGVVVGGGADRVFVSVASVWCELSGGGGC